ncbi:TIGR04255 family protein [Methanosarcina sp. T3]|uniref:TIGR04255 family protein n=1 Tax=Methanosarcina sp. T3 TaxID=3439062 RepID=UPI003F833615
MGSIIDKSVIKREDFHHNFLTKGIIRLDYVGIIDIKDTIKELSSYLHEKGYTEESEYNINELSIKLSDPIKIETMKSISTEEFTRNKSYKFFNPNDKNYFEITKFFITLVIDYSTYKSSDYYIDLFAGISEKILSSKDTFIKPLRIGQRKINSLVIFGRESDLKKEMISNYFETPYFSAPFEISSKIGTPSELIVHNAVDTLNFDDISVNITRNISKGLLRIRESKKSALRLLFDIDCYLSEDLQDVLNDRSIKATLTAFNKLNFDLYKNAITLEFIQKLTSDEEFSDSNIIGVRRNNFG